MKTMIRFGLLLIAAFATGSIGTTVVAATPTITSATPSGEEDSTVEARLEAARKRLEEAAREVAELSGQFGRSIGDRMLVLRGDSARAIIGIQLDPTSGKEGAHVVEVSPGGPAAEAGIRSGDTIISVNGTTVTGDEPARQVVDALRGVKPNTVVGVQVLRDGKPHDFTITARAGPGDAGFLRALPPLPPIPPIGPILIGSPLSDMELATLTPRLGRYFGTDQGVLVVRAPTSGDLKLEDGDVILAIDGRKPSSGSHATRILASYMPGEKVTLRIVRERKTLDLEARMPEAPGHKGVVILRHGPRPYSALVSCARLGHPLVAVPCQSPDAGSRPFRERSVGPLSV
jgi:S1-C subfamily serine protease